MGPKAANPLWPGFTRSGGSTLGPDWVRPAPTVSQQRFDVIAVVVLLPLFWLRFQLTTSVGLWQDSDRAAFEAMVWSVVLGLAFAVRRRYPLWCLMYGIAAASLATIFNPQAVSTFPLDLFLYSLVYTAAAWGQSRKRTNIALAILVLSQIWSLAYRINAPAIIAQVEAVKNPSGNLPAHFSNSLFLIGLTIFYTTASWIVGTIGWRNARQQEELRLGAVELKAAQDKNAYQAVLADRVRIARELHDVVAHHVSIIGIQASAARRTMGRDPDSAAKALSEVETSSRQAVGEMRTLLGVLRSEDEPSLTEATASLDLVDTRDPSLTPLPGLSDLPALVEKVSATGLNAQFRVVGQPFPVPRSMGLSLYRSAQEALANVRRHSTTLAAHVTLRYLEGTAVEVDVQDIGSPSGAPQGTGLGHRGMRERASLHGGEVEIGPMPTGGFRVRMRLPITNEPALVEAPASGSAPVSKTEARP
ncbi:histidine kinase [Salinibacterium sp.]|uniref:sensor histidine kinase n=1 Tax=Salinibacterium sp. TaxID=1915057 RepID=UPI00286AB318|nr:histidine kinase [Salinibacterium sp.]